MWRFELFNWVHRLFNPKPNDWILVWNKKGTWTLTNVSRGTESTAYCHFQIYYSKSRSKYELRTEGETPHAHPSYADALTAQALYNEYHLLNYRHATYDEILKWKKSI